MVMAGLKACATLGPAKAGHYVFQNENRVSIWKILGGVRPVPF